MTKGPCLSIVSSDFISIYIHNTTILTYLRHTAVETQLRVALDHGIKIPHETMVIGTRHLDAVTEHYNGSDAVKDGEYSKFTQHKMCHIFVSIFCKLP